ncbi:MAG: Addiction module toxin, RelE/StbE family [Candidatus Roizmanbacteria bacterium GW2011_GWA2_35_19]|uniref:Addiction module toxin, RelE/StbE family n=2 Tax=Candidatus Roizmaniibacteriota TaxID=1752723 RepID=A0A0G0EZ70_9BACT|nr:MAG: Addiction module toxin, RelE/StbE family [Candidatus Roizmanbacteria bacterium GW2011_GWC2_35_12]KKP72442.1 MAG: Addiction module toxin, RelE/StbE family [Candidatus Roizmanbacteria bacterium GW2011_GWA2_35_19]
MFIYVFKNQALRDLQKLPQEIQKRIIKKLDFFVESGEPLSFAENLVNFEIGQYRFRIGDYRVIFDLDDERLIILTLGHRKNIYK